MLSSEQHLAEIVEDTFFNESASHELCVQKLNPLSKRELHQATFPLTLPVLIAVPQLTSLLKNRLTAEIATRNQLANKLSHEQDEVVELQKKITSSAELYARVLKAEENREADLTVRSDCTISLYIGVVSVVAVMWG